MKLAVIACEILYREVSYCVARSKNVVDATFLKKGLHDVGQPQMSRALREEIARVPKDQYEAILLAYGLCSNGIIGLTAEEIPLVVPRAHDCITLLMGSKETYQDYFNKHPGTFFRSSGWIERNQAEIGPDGKPISIMTQLGLNRTFEELVAKYGEDNAKYIDETLGGWGGTRSYNTLAYLDMGIGDFPHHEEQAREEAREKGWQFHSLRGDIDLLTRLIDGEWDTADFLVVQPDQKISPTYADNIIRTEGGPHAGS